MSFTKNLNVDEAKMVHHFAVESSVTFVNEGRGNQAILIFFDKIAIVCEKFRTRKHIFRYQLSGVTEAI